VADAYRRGYFVVLVVLVGVISGFGSIMLYTLIDFSTTLFLENLDSYSPPSAAGECSIFQFHLNVPKIPLWIIPAIGGLLSGLIVYTLAPEAEGEGIDAVVKAYHRGRAMIRGRIPIIKIVTSAITIGSGGSAGREGPIAQIGAGFGSFIGNLFKLTDRERRLLVIAGIGGGLGSIFRSPLGGALFAVEVLYKRDTEVEGLVYAVISSIIAYIVFNYFLMSVSPNYSGTIFRTPPFEIRHPAEILIFGVVGVFAALIAKLYVWVFYTVHDFFKRLKISNYFKPVIGGLLTGIIGIFVPQALEMGYGYAQLAIDGKLALSTILMILFAKIFATSFTVGSGGSGGAFAPSVVIGGMVGGAVGYLMKLMFPTIVTNPGIYVIVGMGAFIAAVAKTPIASITMVVEMSGSYMALPAIMIASAVSYLLSGETTIYREQVDTRADSPAHRRELMRDILEGLKVRDAMTPAENVITVSPKNTLQDVLYLIRETGHLGYPVVENGKIIGMITLSDINSVPEDELVKLRVEDVMSRKIIVVSPEDNLENALKLLIRHDIGRLPVVENGKLVGIITRSDIMRAHAKELARLGI